MKLGQFEDHKLLIYFVSSLFGAAGGLHGFEFQIYRPLVVRLTCVHVTRWQFQYWRLVPIFNLDKFKLEIYIFI